MKKLYFIMLMFAFLQAFSIEPSISGIIEFQTDYIENSDNNKSLEISDPTIEIEITSDLNDNVSAGIVLTNNDNIDLDSAEININESKIYPLISLRKSGVSFGNFESNFNNDSMLKAFSETNANHLYLEKSLSFLNVGISLFNGKINLNDEENNLINSFAMKLAFETELNQISIYSEGSYINNIFESGMFEEISESDMTLSQKNDAFDFNVSLRFSKLMFRTEIISLSQRIEDEIFIDEISLKSKKPNIFLFETNYNLNEKTSLSARYEKASDLENILPSEAFGFNVNYLLFSKENNELSLSSDAIFSKLNDNENETSLNLKLGYSF